MNVQDMMRKKVKEILVYLFTFVGTYDIIYIVNIIYKQYT